MSLPAEIALAKARPTYLRLHRGEEQPAAFTLSDRQQSALDALSRAFSTSTGLELHFAQRNQAPALNAVASCPVAGTGTAPVGTLHAIAPSRDWQGTDRHDVAELVAGLAQLLAELVRTQEALWQREAELAAGVPVAPHREEERHLAERLEAILRSGAEAVGCEAAAMYLLNADTSLLKVRSVFGLPRDRLVLPARSLGGAMADLEALLGHAIVLTDQEQLSLWNIPEPFGSACCLPVSTPMIPLGTVWFFCQKTRDFSSKELGLLEIVSGRLATELEREALLAEACVASRERFQCDAVSRMIESQLPRLRPLSDAWSVAGWTLAQGATYASFHDWSQAVDGRLVATLGHSLLADIDGRAPDLRDGLLAAIVRASSRALIEALDQPLSALQQVNQLLCALSTSEHPAELVVAQLAERGTTHIASAGRLHMVRLMGPDTFRICSRTTPALGADPDHTYLADEHRLEVGESLVAYVDSACDAGDGSLDANLARYLSEQRNRSAADLARDAEEFFAQGPHAHGKRRNASLLVMQRRA